MRRTTRLIALVVGLEVLRRALSRRSSDAKPVSEPAPTSDESKAAGLTRKEVFARSYDEVLAALKHQDDKLNRTLTAIAFLTAAGVALFTRATDLTPRFDESGTSIQAYFFAVFVGATALALTLALAAIGPSTQYRARRQRRAEESADGSLIFYASIVGDPGWSRYITDPPVDLVQHLAENFHTEALNISNRTNYKVVRARESGAFVQLAILSLALLGVFSIDAFSGSTQWWIASVILILLFLAPFHDLLIMHLYRFTEDPVPWRSYACLGTALLAASVLLIRAPSLGQHWPAISYALFAFVASRLALAYRPAFSVRLLAAAALVGVATILILEL